MATIPQTLKRNTLVAFGLAMLFWYSVRSVSLILLVLISAVFPPGVMSKSGKALENASRAGVGDSLQMLVVRTKDWNDLHGTAQRYERPNRKRKWRPAGGTFPVVVGKTGLGWGRGMQPDTRGAADGPVKREGDGKAPAGIFRLTLSFGYSSEPLPGSRIEYIALTPSVECVDDPKSSRYNQLFDTQGVTRDWNSSELMRRGDELYRWGVFVAHNTGPVVSGAGSCIFLHVWYGPDEGTVGCTAMEQANIELLLRWLEPAKHPVLVQLPAAQYALNRNAWSLPAPPSEGVRTLRHGNPSQDCLRTICDSLISSKRSFSGTSRTGATRKLLAPRSHVAQAEKSLPPLRICHPDAGRGSRR